MSESSSQENSGSSRGEKKSRGPNYGGQEESKSGMFDRLTYNYIDGTNKPTLIFSQLSPDEIADRIISKLIDLGFSPQIDEHKWKLSCTLTRDLSDQEIES